MIYSFMPVEGKNGEQKNIPLVLPKVIHNKMVRKPLSLTCHVYMFPIYTCFTNYMFCSHFDSFILNDYVLAIWESAQWTKRIHGTLFLSTRPVLQEDFGPTNRLSFGECEEMCGDDFCMGAQTNIRMCVGEELLGSVCGISRNVEANKQIPLAYCASHIIHQYNSLFSFCMYI